MYILLLSLLLVITYQESSFSCRICRYYHRRSQDFFLWVHFSSPENLTTFFIVVGFKTRTKTTKLTTPTVQLSSISSKLGLLLCLRVNLQLSPVNPPPNFFSDLGVYVHPAHPWLLVVTIDYNANASLLLEIGFGEWVATCPRHLIKLQRRLLQSVHVTAVAARCVTRQRVITTIRLISCRHKACIASRRGCLRVVPYGAPLCCSLTIHVLSELISSTS